MNAVISQYFTTEEKAMKRASELRRLHKGRLAWYVLVANNGYFVMSETVARKSFPNLDFSYKDRAYENQITL